jgi:hypothetical protein
VPRARLHLGPDPGHGEFGAHPGDQLAERGPPVVLRLPDKAEDPLVRLGGEGRERQVLDLPLVVIQPEPLGERHEQLHGRPGDPLALLPLGVVAQGAQVVHAVGELDDEDPQVDRGGEDHLAERLALGVVTPLRPVELGHPVDEDRDLRAELRLDLADRQASVLDGVVQQRGDQRRRVHPDVREEDRHGQGMGDVGRARLAGLPAVPVVGDGVGAAEQPRVGTGEDPPVGGDQRQDRVPGARRDVRRRARVRGTGLGGACRERRQPLGYSHLHVLSLSPQSDVHPLRQTLAAERPARSPLRGTSGGS